MTVKIALSLPDSVYDRAQQLAQFGDRDIADVLTEAITLYLFSEDVFETGGSKTSSPAGIPSDIRGDSVLKPVASLSDTEVIALSELQMEPQQDRRLSELLEKQQAGTLTEAETPELSRLMQIYRSLLLRKARALRVAVERGLREPLTP
ncbi:MAG: hypothetical protein SXA11_00555 [Cyanobacteriota bacterium]|nr:hypothetical protein [Cyanobacteriota bacterium]